MEFYVGFDILEFRLDVLGAVFGASEVDERLMGFFWAILF